MIFNTSDPTRESSGGGEGRSGASGRGGADQGGEHFEGEPPDKEPGRGRWEQQLHGEAEVGRRRDLQELREGGGREAAAEVHQRHPEERVSQEVHGQVRKVNIFQEFFLFSVNKNRRFELDRHLFVKYSFFFCVYF